MLDIKIYKVYIEADDRGRITAINSSAFLANTEGWTEIDSGFGDRYHHAQNNYFPLPIMDERGILRYKIVPFVDWPEGEIIQEFHYEGEEYGVFERTQEEMDADYAEPVPTPTDAERIADLEAAMTAIEEGIASV